MFLHLRSHQKPIFAQAIEFLGTKERSRTNAKDIPFKSTYLITVNHTFQSSSESKYQEGMAKSQFGIGKIDPGKRFTTDT